MAEQDEDRFVDNLSAAEAVLREELRELEALEPENVGGRIVQQLAVDIARAHVEDWQEIDAEHRRQIREERLAKLLAGEGPVPTTPQPRSTATAPTTPEKKSAPAQ